MKSIEQLEKEEAMFEKIGVYYDSSQRRAENVKAETFVVGTLNLASLEAGDCKIDIRINAPETYKEHAQPLNLRGYYSNDDLITLISKVDSHFLPLEADEHRAYSSYGREHEKFNISLVCEAEYPSLGKKTFEYDLVSVDTFDLKKLIQPGIFHLDLNQTAHISKIVKFSAKVKRCETQEKVSNRVAELFKRRRGNLEPKEWFAKICDGSVSETETCWHRGRKYPAFRGELKKRIFRADKSAIIFLIEYLFGVKIPKTAPLADVHAKLRSLGYSDLGIKDVRKMSKLLEVLYRCHSVQSYKRELAAAGFEPVKGIDRWLPKEQSESPKLPE